MYHWEAGRLFDKARDERRGRPIGTSRNTRLVRTPGGYGIRLYDTVVVEIRPDGTYRLDSGGWRTMTTRARINEFSSAWVYSDGGVWYVRNAPFWPGRPVGFQDGMVVDSKGRVMDVVAPMGQKG